MIELTSIYPSQRIIPEPELSTIALKKVILISHLSYLNWVDDFIKIYLCIRLTNNNGRSESHIWHPFNEISFHQRFPIAEYDEIIQIGKWATEVEVSLLNTELLTGDEVIGVFLDFPSVITQVNPETTQAILKNY